MANYKDKDDIEFLDDDLAADFIGEDETEAFLNEVGSFREEKTEKEKAVKPQAKADEPNPVEDSEPAGESESAAVSSEPHSSRVGRSRKRVEGVVGKEAFLENERYEKIELSEPLSPVKAGKGKKTAAIAVGAAVLILLAGGGVYAAMGHRYNKVFFPNTQINGINASGKTVQEVELLISAGVQDYVLTIEERDGKTEEISRKDINLRSEFDGSLEKLLETQEPLQWLKYKLQPSSYQIKTMLAYDEDALEAAISGLDCMNQSLMTAPQDAALSAYVSGQGYTIVPEIAGNTTIPETVKESVVEAVLGMKEKLSLEEAGAYQAPVVRKDDPVLTALLAEVNRYTGLTVTYKFGDSTEVLTGDRINEWLVVGEDRKVTLDAAKVAGYVEELSLAHDTYNKAKTLKTSYGPTITVTGGTYGWKINRSAETEELTAIIQAGVSTEREPVYVQKAASRGSNDYGNTYVEMNLTAQHLFFYKDGSLLVESDFVSGNVSKGWTTPPGSFPLMYKQRNATLKGEGYKTPVDYWMPFNGGIGMHDAGWRSSFGGAIYKTGGSHGCINLPPSVAKKIYENIAAGIPVLCYNLAGTESGGTSSTKPAETPAVPPETPPTEPPVPVPPEPQLPQPPQPQPPQPPQPQPGITPEQQPGPGGPATTETAPAGPGSDTVTGTAAGPGAM